MPKLKAVFFDLDGTLLDTAADMSAALNSILKEDGRPERPYSDTRYIVSDGSAALIKKGYSINDGSPDFAPLRDRFLQAYSKALNVHTRPFDGILALLNTLTKKNIAWGVVTNKPATYAEPLMRALEFPSRPCCVICPEHVVNRKPAAEPMYLACKIAHCLPEEAIYIGDHLRDIESGKNASMPTIAASYGFLKDPSVAQQWGADYIANSAHAIWPLIHAHFSISQT